MQNVPSQDSLNELHFFTPYSKHFIHFLTSLYSINLQLTRHGKDLNIFKWKKVLYIAFLSGKKC